MYVSNASGVSITSTVMMLNVSCVSFTRNVSITSSVGIITLVTVIK